MELSLYDIKVGHKRTVILKDETFWCTNEEVTAKKG